MERLTPSEQLKKTAEDWKALSDRTKITTITLTATLMLLRSDIGLAEVLWKVVLGLSATLALSSTEAIGLPKFQVDYFSMLLSFHKPWLLLVIPTIGKILTKVKRRVTTNIKSRKGEVATTVTEHALMDSQIASSIWQAMELFHIQIMGTTLRMEYVDNPDLNQDVIDEFSAIKEFASVETHINEAAKIQWSFFIFAFLLFCISIGGLPAAAIGISVLMIIKGVESTENIETQSPVYRAKGSPIGRKNGIYYLKSNSLGEDSRRGVCWVQDGTLYTRYHVTSGCSIDVGNGNIFNPCYINKKTDNVAYGSAPKYANVIDGQEITVALIGIHSMKPIMYRTHAKKSPSGSIIFPGLRSSPGCSGSPIFIDKTREVTDADDNLHIVHEKVYCGSVGWFFDHKPEGMADDDDRAACEIMAQEKTSMGSDVPIIAGDVVQYFNHPGSGKTRTIVPSSVRRGLDMFGKVYVTGPTKPVCTELYRALEAEYPNQVALMTSSASYFERGSPNRRIIIAAHPTFLSMLVRGSEVVRPKGLWIMDEAHFVNSKSMQLKDMLRHLVIERSAGALLEMTATGWDYQAKELVVKDGSNYPIEDITMSEDEMIAHLDDNIDEGKSIVFVTSIDGPENTSSKKLEQRYAGRNIVVLNRKTFNENYAKAADPKTTLVLTTDISECGANFDGDKLYDFQRSAKPIRTGPCIMHEQRTSDMCQRVQRRGRVGRTKAGTYISPGYMLQAMDFDRADYFDRAIFARALGITILDSMPTDLDCMPILTKQQIKAWVSTDDNGIESAWLIKLLTTQNGNSVPPDSVMKELHKWRDGKGAMVTVGKKEFRVSFWDSRDSEKFLLLARAVHLLEDKSTKHVAVQNALRKWSRYLNKTLSETTILDVFSLTRSTQEGNETQQEAIVELDRDEDHDS